MHRLRTWHTTRHMLRGHQLMRRWRQPRKPPSTQRLSSSQVGHQGSSRGKQRLRSPMSSCCAPACTTWRTSSGRCRQCCWSSSGSRRLCWPSCSTCCRRCCRRGRSRARRASWERCSCIGRSHVRRNRLLQGSSLWPAWLTARRCLLVSGSSSSSSSNATWQMHRGEIVGGQQVARRWRVKFRPRALLSGQQQQQQQLQKHSQGSSRRRPRGSRSSRRRASSSRPWQAVQRSSVACRSAAACSRRLQARLWQQRRRPALQQRWQAAMRCTPPCVATPRPAAAARSIWRQLQALQRGACTALRRPRRRRCQRRQLLLCLGPTMLQAAGTASPRGLPFRSCRARRLRRRCLQTRPRVRRVEQRRPRAWMQPSRSARRT